MFSRLRRNFTTLTIVSEGGNGQETRFPPPSAEQAERVHAFFDDEEEWEENLDDLRAMFNADEGGGL